MVSKFQQFRLWRRFVKLLRTVALAVSSGKKVKWSEIIKKGLAIVKDAIGTKDEEKDRTRRLFGRRRR
jgi:hypothetical protein